MESKQLKTKEYQEQLNKLMKDALLAEELFTLDELEEHADKLREQESNNDNNENL